MMKVGVGVGGKVSDQWRYECDSEDWDYGVAVPDDVAAEIRRERSASLLSSASCIENAPSSLSLHKASYAEYGLSPSATTGPRKGREGSSGGVVTPRCMALRTEFK